MCGQLGLAHLRGDGRRDHRGAVAVSRVVLHDQYRSDAALLAAHHRAEVGVIDLSALDSCIHKVHTPYRLAPGPKARRAGSTQHVSGHFHCPRPAAGLYAPAPIACAGAVLSYARPSPQVPPRAATHRKKRKKDYHILYFYGILFTCAMPRRSTPGETGGAKR